MYHLHFLEIYIANNVRYLQSAALPCPEPAYENASMNVFHQSVPPPLHSITNAHKLGVTRYYQPLRFLQTFLRRKPSLEHLDPLLENG